MSVVESSDEDLGSNGNLGINRNRSEEGQKRQERKPTTRGYITDRDGTAIGETGPQGTFYYSKTVAKANNGKHISEKKTKRGIEA